MWITYSTLSLLRSSHHTLGQGCLGQKCELRDVIFSFRGVGGTSHISISVSLQPCFAQCANKSSPSFLRKFLERKVGIYPEHFSGFSPSLLIPS